MSTANKEPKPVAVIETDAFCEECGFNLRTQSVWRDPTLNIAISRCPECGRHHAAGMKTTAGSAWARRAALAGLVFWLVVQLAFVVGVFFSFVGFSAAASEGLISSDHMTRDGRLVLMRNTNGSGTGPNAWEFALGEDQPFNLPISEVVYGKRLAPWLAGQTLKNDDYRFATPLQAGLITMLFAVLTVADGIAMASLAWFWRRGTKWLWLLLPAFSTLFVMTLVSQDRRGGFAWTGVPYTGQTVELKLTAAVGLLIALALALGLSIGLPVTRFLVSVFIPPKARQLFAFFWHCDGKTMPYAKP